MSGLTGKLFVMWETFWPDVLVAVLGSMLTVAIAYATYWIQRRRAERQLLNNLVNDLSHRRALRQITPRAVKGANGLEDYDRTSQSVIDMRDQIRSTREHLPPESRAHGLLSAMHSACNRHLHLSSRNPDKYQFYLMDLRKELELEIREISQRVRKIDTLPPGSSAY